MCARPRACVCFKFEPVCVCVCVFIFVLMPELIGQYSIYTGHDISKGRRLPSATDPGTPLRPPTSYLSRISERRVVGSWLLSLSYRRLKEGQIIWGTTSRPANAAVEITLNQVDPNLNVASFNICKVVVEFIH